MGCLESRISSPAEKPKPNFNSNRTQNLTSFKINIYTATPAHTHKHTLEQKAHTLKHTQSYTRPADTPEQHFTHFLLAALQKLCKVVLETYYAISVWPQKSNGSAKRAGGGSGQAAKMPEADKKATLTNGNIFVCPCRVLLSQSKSANFHLAPAVISLNGVIGQTNKRNRRNEGAAKKPAKQSRSRRINEICHSPKQANKSSVLSTPLSLSVCLPGWLANRNPITS